MGHRVACSTLGVKQFVQFCLDSLRIPVFGALDEERHKAWLANHELKAKVDGVCNAVAAPIADRPAAETVLRGVASGIRSIGWWPEGLGTPAAAGSQNAMRYAFFPAARRLVIDDNGSVSMYHTGEHYLTGISQQQSSTQTLAFSDTNGASVDCRV
jgi:hypothetical protein